MQLSRKQSHCISIHALRKESDLCSNARRLEMEISIHALRKESDGTPEQQWTRWRISIHALRKESDQQQRATRSEVVGFQSTLSVRRAT